MLAFFIHEMFYLRQGQEEFQQSNNRHESLTLTYVRNVNLYLWYIGIQGMKSLHKTDVTTEND